MFDWMQQHGVLVAVLGVAAAATFVLMLLLVPLVVVRLPADYFCRDRQESLPRIRRYPVLRWAWRIGKNAAGLVFLLAGLLLLLLPAPGLPILLAGLMLLDFPGKRALVCWIVSRPPVLRAFNGMRRKAGRGPLVLRPPR